MKAYKCDICEKLFEGKSDPILSTRLERLVIEVEGFHLNADICPECLEILRKTVSDLSLVTEEIVK